MIHDFSKVFETENELWDRVLEIFEKNEEFPKKKVKGRELHHKFPRSFSKKLKEKIDNDKDNLISLTPEDHFRIHYYYYILARKGFRQPMAMAFNLMMRPISKQISPATMEECAIDYEELRRESIQAQVEKIREWRENNPEKEKERIEHIKEAISTDECKAKKSNSMKGKNKGENNGMYGKEPWTKTHSFLEMMTEDEIKRWKDAISRTQKGRQKSKEECEHISESKKGDKNPMFRRFSWKQEDGTYKNIVLPDCIADSELDDVRKVLRFLYVESNGNWKRMVLKLIEILKRMDKLNSYK